MHAESYRQSSDPDRRLSVAIYEILAVTTSSVLDRSLVDTGGAKSPGWIGEWPDETRTKLLARMENDPMFAQLVVMRGLHLIEDEIRAWETGACSVLAEREDPVLAEREACACVAESYITDNGTPEGIDIARLIRERGR